MVTEILYPALNPQLDPKQDHILSQGETPIPMMQAQEPSSTIYDHPWYTVVIVDVEYLGKFQVHFMG